MKNNDFTEVMKKNSNKELIKIVTIDKGKYQESAIIAAKNEITKRNLTLEELETVTAKANNDYIKIKDRKNQKLGVSSRILFFLFFWGLFPFLIAVKYKKEGYSTKYNEANKYMKYGLIAFIISVITVIIIAKIVL